MEDRGYTEIIAGLRRVAHKSLKRWEDSLDMRGMKGSGAASTSFDRALRNLIMAEDRANGVESGFYGSIKIDFMEPPSAPKA